MIFWFVGTAVLSVWYVFRDPRFDYRLLVVGAVLPELDVVTGGLGVLHTLVFSVAVLTAVMLSTIGRRPIRKLLLGLPIGTFLHLVFDGAWATTHVFWWPLGGTSFSGADLPAVQRGWWNVPLEAAGVAITAWIWRTAGLHDHVRRRAAWRTGRIFVSS